MTATLARTACTAAATGRYGCDCPDCVASTEAEAEHEFLNERGMDYAYSGHSGSEAMQLAHQDLYYLKLRARLPELRAEFVALRGAWYDHRCTAEAPALWERLFGLYLTGCEAGGRDFYDTAEARREFCADITNWARKNG